MDEKNNHNDIVSFNERSLNKLTRSITLSQGRFSLTLACCNYTFLRKQIIQNLRQRINVEIDDFVLEPSVKTLYTTLQSEFSSDSTSALMILGLDSINDIDDLLILTNQVRDEFRSSFSFPLILWINDTIRTKLIRLVPDFNSWTSSPIRFDLPTHELVKFLWQLIQQVFATVLDSKQDIFVPNSLILGPLYYQELESARNDLINREQKLEPSLQAGIKFLLGREAYSKDNIDAALDNYSDSITIWEQVNDFEKKAASFLHIGLCYIRKASLEPTNERQHWEAAREYLEKCLEEFEKLDRLDLVARFINQLGEVLRCLKLWSPLQSLAERALKLHEESYRDPILLSQDYGFFAETALARKNERDAYVYCLKALDILSQSPEKDENQQSKCLLLLARAQQRLGRIQEAFASLDQAKKISNPQSDPRTHIQILEELRLLYFHQGERSEEASHQLYSKAFHIKKIQRSVEQQYGFRAFIGADRLQAKGKVSSALAGVEYQESIAKEITFSGREEDVNYLIKKISEIECKLLIIHGQSGVGKSSLLDGGFIPSATGKRIYDKTVVPILIRTYTNWETVLQHALGKSLLIINRNDKELSGDENKSIEEQLVENEELGILTVLIFDQFEELFFTANSDTRKALFNFIQNSIDGQTKTPYVKIIISIREDYLHYLLEYERIFHENRIDALNDILRRANRYHLGNLSLSQGDSVIREIAKNSNLNLTNELIDELVQDLTNEFGEVRPIELQLVGAQLQNNDDIRTPKHYRTYGSKKGLVENFLNDVIKDCGSQNERTARLVLFLMTDQESVTRPLKTQSELASALDDMEVSSNTNNLNLILEVLSGSGIIYSLLDSSTKRYQLVHDYLAELIKKNSFIQTELAFTKNKKTFEDNLHKQIQSEREKVEMLMAQVTKQAKLIKSLQQNSSKTLEIKKNNSEQIIESDKNNRWRQILWNNPLGRNLTEIILDVAKLAGNNKIQALDNRVELAKAAVEYVGRYQRRYGFLKLLGMARAVSLDQIYVSVQLLDASGRNSFESLESLEATYRSQKKRRIETNSHRFTDITVANQCQYLTVLGGPGSGKSTFLRKVGLEAFKGKGGSFKHSCIPILLELKTFITGHIDLVSIIVEEFERVDFSFTREFVIETLKRGKFIVLLDGLDEVPAVHQVEVVNTIQDFVDVYQNNRFIITCRTAAYLSTFRRFTDVVIGDFSNEQIQVFIQNWFKSDLDQQSQTAQRCWATLNQPVNASIKELAQTPLFLILLCLVYSSSQSFPSNRSALYDRAVNILLNQWSAEKRVYTDVIYQGLHIELEKALLSEIAYRSFEQDKYFFTERELVDEITTFLVETLDQPRYLNGPEVLQAIAVQQGILVERVTSVYSFSHLVFQEFFTASYIARSNRIKDLVSNHLFDKRWREVFLLVAGLLDNADVLLLAMQAIANEHISTANLSILFHTINRISDSTDGKISSGSKRAIVTSTVLSMINGIKNIAKKSSAQRYELTRKAPNIVPSEIVENEFQNIQTLVSSLAKFKVNGVSNYLITDKDTINQNIFKENIIKHIKFAREYKIYQQVDFDGLLLLLSEQKAQVNLNEGTSKAFSKKAMYNILHYFNIPAEIVENISDIDINYLDMYCYACLVIISCKESSIRVSRRVWERIESQLFLPPDMLNQS